jgi:hypothetical protein
MPAAASPTLDWESLAAVESSAHSYAYVESADATDGPAGAREGIGLGAVLVILSPFALAAWVAIGLGVYRVVA